MRVADTAVRRWEAGRIGTRHPTILGYRARVNVKVRIPPWATHVVSDHTDMDRAPRRVNARTVSSFTVRLPDDAYFEYGFVAEDGSIHADPDRTGPLERADNPWYPDLSCVRGPRYVPDPWSVGPHAEPQGTFQRVRLGASTSPRLADARNVVVYEPPGATGLLPLLLVADGTAYRRIAHLPALVDQEVASGRLPEMRVAFFDPTRPETRRDEFGAGSATVDAWHGRWLPELIEVARATDGTFLLGASLGASHLLELAWQRPDAFAGLALQSGAFLGTPDRPDPYRSTRSWVLERLAAEGLRLPWRVYLEVGSFDWLHPVVGQVAERLRERVAGGDDAVRYEVRSAGHNWTFWRDGLRDALLHLFAVGRRYPPRS